MVIDGTFRIDTTGSWTRVSAFELNTRLVAGTIWIDGTLGSTEGWCSNVGVFTSAARLSVHITTYWVLPTWWWDTRIHIDWSSVRDWSFCYYKLITKLSYNSTKHKLITFIQTRVCKKLTRHCETVNERISSETSLAGTNWTTIDSLALGVDSTGSWTGIAAFSVDTSSVCWTLRTYCTFWSTSWRTSNVLRQTWTDTLLIHYSALTVCSTWGWCAWIYRNRREY